MSTIEVMTLTPANFIIKGDLTFDSIDKKSINIFNFKQLNSASTPVINVDLQQLGKIDSAGLALLIEWLKLSHHHKIELRFNNIPAPLSALAKLSYLTDIGLFTTKNS